MGEFQGIKIIKLNGGTGRRNPSTDGVMALVAFTPVMPAGVTVNSAIETIQPLDADALGFNASFDANNNILTKHHIDEFYRLAPNGNLFVIPTDKTTAKAFFESVEGKALFRSINQIKRIGFVYNDDVPALDMDAEINACQTFLTELKNDDILIDGIYLEARNTGKTPADKRILDAPNVSLVAFQDPAIAVLHAKYNT